MPHILEIAQHDSAGRFRGRHQPPSAPFTAMTAGEPHVGQIRQCLYKGRVCLFGNVPVSVNDNGTARRRPVSRHLFGPAKRRMHKHNNADTHVLPLFTPNFPWTLGQGSPTVASLYTFPTICTKGRNCLGCFRHMPCIQRCRSSVARAPALLRLLPRTCSGTWHVAGCHLPFRPPHSS